jgi:hypothetical protein
MAQLPFLGSEIHSGARPVVKDNFLSWSLVAYEIRRQFRNPGLFKRNHSYAARVRDDTWNAIRDDDVLLSQSPILGYAVYEYESKLINGTVKIEISSYLRSL